MKRLVVTMTERDEMLWHCWDGVKKQIKRTPDDMERDAVTKMRWEGML